MPANGVQMHGRSRALTTAPAIPKRRKLDQGGMIAACAICLLQAAAQSPARGQNQSYAIWAIENGLSAGISPLEASAAGDGVSNLVKYALGLDPKRPAVAGDLPVGFLDGDGRKSFRFLKPVGLEALYQVEASSDLQSWRTDVVEQVSLEEVEGGSLVTVREVLSTPSGRAFMRLCVSLPEFPAVFSNDPLAPTPLTFQQGGNRVSGQVDAPRNTRDFFRFTVPAGAVMSGIFLEAWAADGDNLGYAHIDAGTTTVIPTSGTATQFLGGDHVNQSRHPAANNLLQALAQAPAGGTGFSLPLAAGDYVFNIQQTGPQASQYVLRFVIDEAPPAPVRFEVINAGASSYSIDGVTNPTLTLVRGRTYEFNVPLCCHPFWIKTSPTTGTGNAYNTGVTGNGISAGLLTFKVPEAAPDTLYYICQFHSGMRGTIQIIDP